MKSLVEAIGNLTKCVKVLNAGQKKNLNKTYQLYKVMNEKERGSSEGVCKK